MGGHIHSPALLHRSCTSQCSSFPSVGAAPRSTLEHNIPNILIYAKPSSPAARRAVSQGCSMEISRCWGIGTAGPAQNNTSVTTPSPIPGGDGENPRTGCCGTTSCKSWNVAVPIFSSSFFPGYWNRRTWLQQYLRAMNARGYG